MPKLADFSFAVKFDGTLCTRWCGSIPYFAPEVLSNLPYNPLVSDVWSAGVCLYIITNDTFPFIYKEGHEHAMLESQLARKWRFNSRTERTYSEPYKQLMRGMLNPNVDERIRTDQVSRHKWIATKPHAN